MLRPTMPIRDHFAAYLTAQQAKENASRTISEYDRLASRLFDECRFKLLRDMQRDALERWLVLREAEGMAARTRNSYLQALLGFCNWCVQTNRLVSNPLAKIDRANEQADRRRQRRAMSEGELQRLLHVARWRPLADFGRQTVRRDDEGKRTSWAYAPLTWDELARAVERARQRLQKNPAFLEELERRGRERALVYKTLVLTGLRRGELASLTVGQLRLEQDPAFIELAAADEKNRQGNSLPLRADLAEELREWLRDQATAQEAAGAGQTLRLDKNPRFAKENTGFQVSPIKSGRLSHL